MRIGVVGLGTAGVTFISEVRRIGIPCELFLFEKRGLSVFHPCSIPEVIEGKIDASHLVEPFGMSSWVKFFGEAKEIDPYTLEISYDRDGERGKVKVDFIFVATGGDIFVPKASDRCLKVTKYEDVIRLRNVLREVRSVGVVGAGVLGLEMASAFLNLSLRVEIFEAKEQILPDFLDKNLADRFQRDVIGERVRIHFGRIIEDMPGGFDLLVFCTGFRPVSPLPFEIRVDEQMRVIDPRSGRVFGTIFAAGDCVSYDRRIPRVASVAAEQGRVAARNIAGIISGGEPGERYEPIIPPVVLKAFGYEVGKVARLNKRADSRRFHVSLRVLPFDDKKIHTVVEVDSEGYVQEVQAFCELRSEVRHLLDLSYVAIKRGIRVDEMRRFELAYQPEICRFPDPVTSLAEFVSRRLNLL